MGGMGLLICIIGVNGVWWMTVASYDTNIDCIIHAAALLSCDATQLWRDRCTADFTAQSCCVLQILSQIESLPHIYL